MKTKKLLLALALPTLFAACTNEVLVESAESQQPIDELVGANLISSGLKINVTKGIESRVDANGNFTLTDKLGLGWFDVVGDVKGTQTINGTTNDPVVYVNNMFQMEEEGGDFVTYGNIYEGYHFAYFPYLRSPKPVQKSIAEVNVPQTQAYSNAETHDKALWMSPRVFITDKDVEGDRLDTKKSFEMQRVVNVLKVTAALDENIYDEPAMSALSLTSVEIDLGTKAAFSRFANIYPINLPVATYNEETGKMELDKEWTAANLFGGNNTFAFDRDSRTKLETTLEGDFASLTNSEVAVRMFTFPTLNAGVTLNDVTVTFKTVAGSFAIKYEPTAEEDSNEAVNNAAIEKLVAFLSTEGYEANGKKYSLTQLLGNTVATLGFKLDSSMFDAEYLIENIDQWNTCVTLASAIETEKATFTIKKGANVVFDTTHPVTVPTNGVNVQGQGQGNEKITINGEVEWPASITALTEGAYISVEDTENNEAVLRVSNQLYAYNIVNKGTIKVESTGRIGYSNDKILDNTNGEVVIAYGAGVYPKPGMEGKISYRIPENYDLKKINNLFLNKVGEVHANVNNLVVMNGITLECVEEGSTTGVESDNDPYNPSVSTPSVPTKVELNFNGKAVDMEINGGSVVAPEGFTESVNNVVMNGGSIKNVNIAGTLTVNEVAETRAATIAKAETLTVAGNVDVAGVAEFTDVKINGTLAIEEDAKVVFNSEEIIQMAAIVNDGGELISNNDIKVENITLQNKSVTTLGEDWDKTIWYTGKLVQNNSQVNGWVKMCPSTPDELAAALEGAVEGTTIYLNDNVTDYGQITVGELKNVTIEGNENSVMIFKTDANTKIENVTLQNVKFEYTGATADCGIVLDENAQIDNLVIENSTFVGTGAKAGRGLSGKNANASIEIKNCTFKDMGYPVYAWGGYESLTIEDCTFENIISWAIMPQSGFDGDLTVTGCTFKDCLGGGLIKAGTLTAGHTFTFTNNTITGCTVAGDHNWFQFNVSAGTSVISGNTKDGADWTPGIADGLK